MPNPDRPLEPRAVHFDLSHLGQDHPYTFRVALEDRPLVAHDDESRRRHRGENPLLQVIPDEHLTHYLEEAPLPADAIALMQVVYDATPEEAGVAEWVPPGQPVERVALMGVHVPQAGDDAYRQFNLEQRGGAPASAPHPKLAQLGVTLGDIEATGVDWADPAYPVNIGSFQTPQDAAVSLLFNHPNLINLSTERGGFFPTFIIERCIRPAISRTGALVVAIQQVRGPVMMPVPLRDENGQPVVADGQTVLTATLDPRVTAAIPGPLALAIKLANQFTELRGQQYRVPAGVTDADYGAVAITGPGGGAVGGGRPSFAARSLPGTARWTVHNLTSQNGLTVDPNVEFVPRPTVNTWRSTGIWSVEDKESVGRFTPERVAQLLAGQIYLTVSTPERPGGLIRGRLVPDGPVAPCDNAGVPCQTTRFRATLDGAQADPPVATQARGEATFVLNAPRTGLTWEATATDLGGSADAAFTRVVPGSPPQALREVGLSNATGLDRLRVTVTNHYLRHLGAYVSFLDAGGRPLRPQSWADQLPDYLDQDFEPDDTKKFVSTVGPVSTLFGFPLPATPTVMSIPLPEGTVTVRLFWGGLGRGPYDSAVCPIGIALTLTLELALPVILLLAGAALASSKRLEELLADRDILFSIAAVGGFLATGGAATQIAIDQNPLQAAKGIAIKLGQVLARKAAGGFARWLETQVAVGVAKRSIPLVDIAFAAFDTVVTSALLVQTTVQVLDSPFVYSTDLSRSIDLAVEVVPDRRFGKFPDFHDRFRLTVVYDVGATGPLYEANLPPATLSQPMTITFRAVPAGGRLKVLAFFYAGNGWQSGQGETAWLPARGTDGTPTLTIRGLEVRNNELPLGPRSVYQHRQKIGFANGRHAWVQAPGQPPAATRTTPPPAPGKRVVQHRGITVAQAAATVGYSWQATGLGQPRDRPNAPPSNAELYTVQSLSTLEDPETGYSIPAVAFTQPSGLYYDLAAANDPTGLHYFIDPTRGEFDAVDNPDGGFHLRRIQLVRGGRPDFATITNRSWGRFPAPLDRFVVHPQGYVLGIAFQTSKIYRLQLPPGEMRDARAPMAALASGEGFRDGLISGPSAIAVALEGRVLILESLNDRIQAFDVFGNPVPFFRNPARPAERIPTLDLGQRSGITYLDMAVESQGYIYVLGYTGDGAQPADYRMSLYRPDGTLLSTTPNVTAARLTVDLQRSLYTLNYETILGAGGRTEPSVSMWLPPPPER